MRLVVALGVLVLCVAPACKRDNAGGAPGPTKVKLQLNWVAEPEFGGFYAARESGAYAKQQLEVDIVGGGAGTPVLQMVASGQADFGIVSADDVLIARARGVDVVAVFAAFQHSPHGVMVHGARGVKKLEDLKSGTLALEPGLPFGQWLKKKYAFEGVTIVPYDGGIAKFLADPNHAQQCYVTSEPIAAKRKGSDPQIFSAKELGFDPYASVVIVRSESLKTKLPTVRAFVAASREGWTAYLADPKPANTVMGKLNTSMDGETFTASAKVQEPLVRGEAELGSMTAERFTTLASQLVELGTIPKAPPASECFATP